jgi:hypothetical protein
LFDLLQVIQEELDRLADKEGTLSKSFFWPSLLAWKCWCHVKRFTGVCTI